MFQFLWDHFQALFLLFFVNFTTNILTPSAYFNIFYRFYDYFAFMQK